MVVRWSDALNITWPHHANTSRMNLLQKKSFKWRRWVCTTQPNSAKKAWLCPGPCHNQQNFNNYAGQTPLNNKGGKVFVTGPYNAKKALMNTGAFFAEKGTVEPPPCDSKLLGARDSLMVVWCSPHVHTLRTQDERLLSFTIKTDETKQSCQPRFRNRRPARIMVMGAYHKTTLCKYRNDRRWHLFAHKKSISNLTLVKTNLPISWWNDVHHGTRQCNRNDDNNSTLLANRKSHNVNEDAWTSARLKD